MISCGTSARTSVSTTCSQKNLSAVRMTDGISYTEFSYMLLQAYDFLTLYDRHGCLLQMGGSDQWGNITAGVDLIRRVRRSVGSRACHAADHDGVGR